MAAVSDRRIRELEDNFGRINFDARVYSDPDFLSFDGEGIIETDEMIEERKERVVETIKRLKMRFQSNDRPLEHSEFDELIWVGQWLAQYQQEYYIPPDDTVEAEFEEIRGDWPARWREVVWLAAEARKPEQTKLSKISGDVSGEDWDCLFGWYLRNDEIRLNIPIPLPESITWKETEDP